MDIDLRVALEDEQWQLVSERTSDLVTLANDYLGYLADRNYSPQTVRTYAFCAAGVLPMALARGHRARRGHDRGAAASS